MEDTPDNSHIHFDILTSFAKPGEPPSWAYVYLLLRKNTSPEDILKGFPSFIKEVESSNPDRIFIPHLQKITDIHLYSNKDREVEPNGNITNIFLFAAIALVLLAISWSNYYNLNKARIPDLAKQIHIQRIMGAGKRIIAAQSVLESAYCVLVAGVLSFFLLGFFGQVSEFFTGHSLLTGRFSGFLKIWPFMAVIIVISILSGSLPVMLYILDPVQSLRGIKKKHQKNKSGFSSYGILIAVQFFLAIVLLTAAITINRQKEFMLSKGTGKMDSDILVFKKQNWEIRFKYQTFRNKALQDPLIKSVSAAMEEPTGETLDALQVESPEIDENHKGRPLYVLSVEDNFLDFFNLRLVAGRNFSFFNPDRKGEDYILNETAVKQLGWTADQAIGRPFNILFDSPGIFYGGTIVGVVQDFYYTSMKQEIKPYVMFQKPIFYLCFLVKVDHARREEAILNLKKIWEEELPDYPFQYEFLNDLYKSAYRKELTQSNLTSFFSVLAMLIICLGLISVTSVLLARRTKEIGIRKVNGANILNILSMLNSFFIKWFAIAFVAACPVAWYATHKWLQNFIYRTDVKWWLFALAGFLVLAVTLITVSFQARRTATKNPVQALRYE
jgi:putative ABC transport system permease protein